MVSNAINAALMKIQRCIIYEVLKNRGLIPTKIIYHNYLRLAGKNTIAAQIS